MSFEISSGENSDVIIQLSSVLTQ